MCLQCDGSSNVIKLLLCKFRRGQRKGLGNVGDFPCFLVVVMEEP